MPQPGLHLLGEPQRGEEKEKEVEGDKLVVELVVEVLVIDTGNLDGLEFLRR